MALVLRPFRLIGIVFVVLSFLTAMALLRLVIWDRWRRTYWSTVVLILASSGVLFCLSIRPKYVGEEHVKDANGILLVGNHLTYIDVMVISSHIRSCFVTSVEIKHSIGLGQICQMAGCLFVERRNKMNILNEVSEIKEGLQKGLNVAIFPESTSTNGEQVLRFRKPLFLAGMHANAPIVPFCINYRRIGGEPISLATRDNIFWYGDMDFVPHIWRLAGAGGVDVELTFLPPIMAGPEDDANEVAARAQLLVESVFTPVKV